MEEYVRVADTGVLSGQRIELIDGEIIEMSPQSSLHAALVGITQAVLTRVLGHGFWVRVQMPLCISVSSEPEPDLTVVRGCPRDYLSSHPETADLAVEIAVESLLFDREVKSSLYASKAVAEYWVVHAKDRKVEVFREPGEDASARFGFQYRRRFMVGKGDQINTLLAPDVMINVDELLP
ncbi:MAG: Uma2 family endonuclease [Phycisphaeraceae bacterium]|nr:Uma2 family endonuclease [Phycisphaeraceae bacterium]